MAHAVRESEWRVFREVALDRLILKVAPVVFGEGIPLSRAEVRADALRLRSRRVFDSGYSISEYLGRAE